MIIPVIIAGGKGSRLWPLSRELYPKQLFSLVDENTMLQNTVCRLRDYPGISEPIVICNDSHRFLVAEQLRQIDMASLSIMLEPVGRNTAPALAAAAIKARDSVGEDAHLLVLPADHDMRNVGEFHRAIGVGEKLSAAGRLVTFGIVPDLPETGYGYIKRGESVEGVPGAVLIDSFVEKPDLEKAKGYVESGKFYWNSGMFMFRVSRILEELGALVPDIVECCERAVADGYEDLDFFRLDEESFRFCPEDSIDYAVMEKTRSGAMVPFDAQWNDLGSWGALWDVGSKDAAGNVFQGDVVASEVSGSYINAQSRMVAAVGLEGHVVVETPDAVLVAPRERVQDVKDLVEKLKDDGRSEAVYHRKVYRPWGSYESVDVAENFQVKRIVVKPGAQLSLQKHFHRAEHWIVVRGTAIVTRGESEHLLKEGESIYIPLGEKHRLENPGKIPLDLIEVQSGSYLGEDDIVRFEDVYGRMKKQ